MKLVGLIIATLLSISCAFESKGSIEKLDSRFEQLPHPEGQVKDHEVESLQKVDSGITRFAGFYHFGDSEGESTLHLHFSKGIWSAQRQGGVWSEDGMGWIPAYVNFSNIAVDIDGNFSADELASTGKSITRKGKFVKSTNISGQEIKGLKIHPTWTIGYDENTTETGFKYDVDAHEMYAGEYPKSSYRILEKIDLEQLSKEQLQIMRNEIYARYGFKFKQGGAMIKHFEQQEWYRPVFGKVDSFLNTIELENIKLIKRVEADK